MTGRALEAAFRSAGGRVIAALAARYRDLDLAEEAFAEACARAAEAWSRTGPPRDAAAWLYAAASRRALDALRRRRTRERLTPEPPTPPPSAEEAMTGDDRLIPDERLRLIFICCHPAVAPEARAGLTLRLVCGLTTGEIAQAFLTSETTLAQRLVRAKRKIAEAGVPFGLPDPEAWPERLDAVLSTLEVAYTKAYEDAAGAGPHAAFAGEVVRLSGLLAELLPTEPEALALAATVRFTEARRRARLDDEGAMVPLSDQAVSDWDHMLIDEAEALLRRAAAFESVGPRALLAAVHSAHASRRRGGETPWVAIAGLYEALVAASPGPVTQVNRAVALGEARGPDAGLAALQAVDGERLAAWAPWHVARGHLLDRAGRRAEAAEAFRAALALGPAPAERKLLERRLAALT